MLQCNICGKYTDPLEARHYISRENERSGIATAFVKDESQLWDSFDCQWCGCQILAQKRNRMSAPDYEFNDDNEEESGDCEDDTADANDTDDGTADG